MIPVQSGWTDERIASLKRLYADNLSASLIADRLGGVTRNGVIGKVNRLGLNRRDEREIVRKAAKPRRRIYIAKPKPPKPQIEIAPVVDSEIPLSQRKTLMELTDTTCRWPIGEVGHGLFFCGGPADLLGGQPYCCAHMVRAYPPAQAREKAA